MYKHLFVPIDGSSLSHRAMDGSIDLAKQLGAKITGFVVEPDLPLAVTNRDPEVFAERIRDHEAKNELHAKSLLEQFAERAAQAGVEFSGESTTAYNVDNAIVNEAEKHGCDMIVIVTHARSKLGKLIFGSHTREILLHTTLPVLVLH